MSKKIITIGRQFGSGGHEIGKRLAMKLGIPFYDREIVEKAAEKLNFEVRDLRKVDEKVIHNIVFGSFGNISVDRPYNIEDYNVSLSDQVYRAQATVIREMAEEGPCVIVGRCADYVLRGRDDVLRVFIYADEEYRLERLKNVRLMLHERAVSLMKDVDKKRRKHYTAYTSRKWDDPDNYDMILNSGLLGTDYIVELLAKACEIDPI